MGELEDSWQSVAGEFRTLGYAFRDHYKARRMRPIQAHLKKKSETRSTR